MCLWELWMILYLVVCVHLFVGMDPMALVDPRCVVGFVVTRIACCLCFELGFSVLMLVTNINFEFLLFDVCITNVNFYLTPSHVVFVTIGFVKYKWSDILSKFFFERFVCVTCIFFTFKWLIVITLIPPYLETYCIYFVSKLIRKKRYVFVFLTFIKYVNIEGGKLSLLQSTLCVLMFWFKI